MPNPRLSERDAQALIEYLIPPEPHCGGKALVIAVWQRTKELDGPLAKQFWLRDGDPKEKKK
jgi:hypothetical protein